MSEPGKMAPLFTFSNDSQSKRSQIAILFFLSLLSLLANSQASLAGEACHIRVIEEGTGWPVPLVELSTTHHVRFVTDNNGNIAFDLPELMGVETWFKIEGHGYEVSADHFGYRGVKLTPQPGEKLTVTVKRKLPGKRLGRLTGGGLFAESQKLGLEADWQEQGIVGCDTVQTAVHNGKLYWAWGDTEFPGYALGMYDTLGATTAVRPLDSFEPPIRLRYDYFTNKSGRPRPIAKMAGEGPTWISGYASLPDKYGKTRLVAYYVKIQSPLTPYESGLCVWDEATSQFKKHKVLWSKSDESPRPPLAPEGHSNRYTDPAGQEWLLFGDPFPRLKCKATFEAWSDQQAWQPLKPQRSLKTKNGSEEISPHHGSIAWNVYRNKWVTIFTQNYGKRSELGEIWYAEADAPTGPWGPALQVVTHNNYTFYNPRLHPEFTSPDSPILLFEGTYTKQFARHAKATPRYDYNQILYRLDLDELAKQLD